MNQRALIAEFLGTFTLVFIGAGAVVSTTGNGNVVIPALGHGLILAALVYAFGHISGAHVNPAVTIGLLVGKNIEPTEAGLYLVVQFLGGIVAAFVLKVILVNTTNLGETVGSLTAGNIWNAALLEAVLTFFLVSTVYQTAAYGHAGNLAGVAIGFTLGASILAGGPLSGASLNPARTFGPALAAGNLGYVLPYFIGIFGGGIVAGLVHGYVLAPASEQAPAAA